MNKLKYTGGIDEEQFMCCSVTVNYLLYICEIVNNGQTHDISFKNITNGFIKEQKYKSQILDRKMKYFNELYSYIVIVLKLIYTIKPILTHLH